MNHHAPFIIRKSPRIKNYNYSNSNYYFVTICTYQKQCIFGSANELNVIGKIAEQDFINLDSHYEMVHIDHFVVMPNHIHAIVVVDHNDSQPNQLPLDKIIGLYKSGVSRKIKMISPQMKVWQRSFHDHIIRSQLSYEKIWNYIEGNPQNWEDDCFYVSQ